MQLSGPIPKSDKISSVLLYLDEILLHVSRPVRWDSDHVVILDDELQMIANEIVRCGRDRVNIALDYFDATINRVAAWAVGTRAMQKALCRALLEPPALKRMFPITVYTSEEPKAVRPLPSSSSLPASALGTPFSILGSFSVSICVWP